MTLRGLAEVALLSGDMTTARRWHEEAVAAARLARGPEGDVLAMSFAAVRLALWEGRLDEAVAAGAQLVKGRVWDQWFPEATLDLVEAYLAAGEDAALPGFAARIREVSESFPHDHHRGGTRLARARVLLHEGDGAGAVDAALSATTAFAACHAWMALPDALRILGLAIVEEGDVPRGVRVVAAGEAMRSAMGAQAPPYADTALALAASHPAEWADGQAMSWEEAVAYAQRGKGGRKRATSGWDSLTPTEQQVVDLVAQGASNKEVAERLFMSIHTVKSHLTHVFAKLAVSSRSQLAAEATKHR